jgi:hypothetical protein
VRSAAFVQVKSNENENLPLVQQICYLSVNLEFLLSHLFPPIQKKSIGDLY